VYVVCLSRVAENEANGLCREQAGRRPGEVGRGIHEAQMPYDVSQGHGAMDAVNSVEDDPNDSHGEGER
jgi:hypothetical protein